MIITAFSMYDPYKIWRYAKGNLFADSETLWVADETPTLLPRAFVAVPTSGILNSKVGKRLITTKVKEPTF